MNTALEIMEPAFPRRHRLNVDEYYRMGQTGVLPADARVELIEGDIIDMAPIGAAHCSIVDELTRVCVEAVGRRGIVRVQGAVRLNMLSEPQPDVTILKPSGDRYRSQHPTAADTVLIIEVSDTTFQYDRHKKLSLYARNGVPEVWIVEIERGLLHVFRSPQAEDYKEVTSTAAPGIMAIRGLPEVNVDLSMLFSG